MATKKKVARRVDPVAGPKRGQMVDVVLPKVRTGFQPKLLGVVIEVRGTNALCYVFGSELFPAMQVTVPPRGQMEPEAGHWQPLEDA